MSNPETCTAEATAEPHSRQYRCTHCDGPSFSRPGSFARHMVQAHPDVPYPECHRCEVCQHPFAEVASLDVHMESHTEGSV